MIGGERRVRRPALQGDGPSARVHDEPIAAVALQDTPDIADVVQQAGDDQVRVVVRLDSLGQHTPAHDVPPDQRDEESMLDVVVEGVALAEAFQRDPRDAVEPLGLVLMR